MNNNDEPTIAEKCYHIWTAVCEGRDVDFTWDELTALQEAGFIENLRREKKNRWSFMWTDRLLAMAEALKKQVRERQPEDVGPVCRHGIAEGHCPDCPSTQNV